MSRPAPLRPTLQVFSGSGKENDKTPVSPRPHHRLRSASTSATAPAVPSRTSRRQSTDASARARSPPRAGARRRAESAFPRTSARPVISYSLPRKLPRHAAMVTPERMANLDPDLAGIPVQYLVDRMKPTIPSLQLGLTAVNTQGAPGLTLPPSSPQPSSIKLTLRHKRGILPTHVLAAIDPKTLKGQLYPIHALVYALQCPTLPLPSHALLSASTIKTEANFSESLEVPLIPIHIPHLASFDLLHAALYNHAHTLTRDLLPSLAYASKLPTAEYANPTIQTRLSYTLAKTYTLPALMERARFMHGFWSNVTMLGVNAEAIWGSMDVAWSVLLEAISLAAATD